MSFQFPQAFDVLKHKPFVNCDVENCCSKVLNKGLCQKHYLKFWRYGDVNRRTQQDSNEIEILNECALIHLYDINSKLVAKAIVDVNSVDVVKMYKWCLTDAGYVRSHKVGFLHRFLMREYPSPIYDHINMNKLDNRKQNIRLCTTSENARNVVKRITNKAGVKGIYWEKTVNKWRATIKIHGKKLNLGYFKEKEDAAKAYNEAAIIHHLAFARIN